MSGFERKHMETLRTLGVRTWFRYVDDIFSTLNSREQATNVLQFLNDQHPNISFTIEEEVGNKLPFWDTLVIRSNNSYTTTLYRKKTFTGVYLHRNWHSLTKRRYSLTGIVLHRVGTKLDLCLAERIWRICITGEDKSYELDNLRSILLRGYPTDIIDMVLLKFREDKVKIILPNFGPEKNKRFIKLPYLSKRCDEFESSLEELINKRYPQVDFTIAISAPTIIEKLFPFKDNVKNLKEKFLVV